MAVTVDNFNIDRALNGEPVGLPIEPSTGVYEEDDLAQLTGFVSRAPGGFKTFIDGVELTLNDQGTVIGCIPTDARFYDVQTGQGVTLMMINEALTPTYGPEQNITRSADTPPTGYTSDVYMSSLQPRDEFAMRAFSVLIQNVENPEAVSDAKMLYISRAAYRWANAMMKAGVNSRAYTPNPTQGEVTVSQGELQSTTDKLLYNLVHLLKQQDQDGITIKDIKKVAGSTIYKGIPIVGDGTTSAEAKPVKMEVSDVKKVAGQTIYKGIPIVGDGTTSAETKPVLTKLDKDSEIKKILEITELKKLTELTEIKKLTELTELKKLTELTEIKKLTEVTDLTNLSTDLGTINTSLGGIDTTLGNIDSDLGTIDSSIDDVATAISQNP